MGKVSLIVLFILLTAFSASGAVSVENLKKLDVPETELWDPVLSPDGNKIAYVAYDTDRSQQIFIVNVDGTDRKKITSNDLKKWGLSWGKDRMAYISFGASGLEKIFVIAPDGTGNKELIPDNTRQGNFERYMVAWGAPSWSPDGSLLAYTSLDEKGDPKIHIVNSDGTGKRSVLKDTFKQWSPSFSPDGKSIVYVSYPETKFKDELFTVDISGTARKQLTLDEIKKNYPVWGPDGTIVYVSYETVTSPGEMVFSINQDGTGKRSFLLPDYKQRSPSFSSDRRKFSYAAIDASGAIKVAVGDIPGITATSPPATTTSTRPAPEKTTPEVQIPEGFGGVLWTMFSVLGLIVIILLALLVIVDFLKKK